MRRLHLILLYPWLDFLRKFRLCQLIILNYVRAKTFLEKEHHVLPVVGGIRDDHVHRFPSHERYWSYSGVTRTKAMLTTTWFSDLPVHFTKQTVTIGGCGHQEPRALLTLLSSAPPAKTKSDQYSLPANRTIYHYYYSQYLLHQMMYSYVIYILF